MSLRFRPTDRHLCESNDVLNLFACRQIRFKFYVAVCNFCCIARDNPNLRGQFDQAVGNKHINKNMFLSLSLFSGLIFIYIYISLSIGKGID